MRPLWSILLAFVALVAAKRNKEPPLPTSWTCPSGWELEESETRRAVELPARLSLLIPADSEDDCLGACEDDPECLEATYDTGSGECGVLLLSSVNAGTFCDAVRARRESIPLQLLATLPCKKGCVQIEKVCQNCEKQSLRLVMAAALCTDLFEHSPETFCSGSGDGSIPGRSGLDEHPSCCEWAGKNECERNPFFMKVRCSASCGTSTCNVKTARSCKIRVREDCRKAGTLPDTTDTPPSKPTDPKCGDRHQLCSFWAWAGECKANPTYMKHNCKLSCKLCA